MRNKNKSNSNVNDNYTYNIFHHLEYKESNILALY